MASPSQLAFDLPWRSADGAEDFLVAPSNEAAVGWIDRWPDWPAGAVVLTGPPAAGKSHLAGLWARRAGAAAITLPELGAAAPAALAMRAPAILLDSIPARLAPADEEPLLHLLNAIRESRGALLMVAESAPAHWEIRLPDLRSRLLAVPQAAIGAPDDALLGALLVKLFRDRGLTPAPELVGYLLRRVERSCAAARRVVGSLDAASLAAGRPVTIALARAILSGD